MNLPNLLSLSRVALMPFIILALKNEQSLALLLLMLAAVATDYFDGFFARKQNKISELGKILDPLADKICIDVMVIFLSLWRGFPWWATGLIILRDLLIMAGGLVVIKKIKRVPASNWPGKVTSTVLALAIILYAFDIGSFQFMVLAIGVVMVVVSGLIYLKEAFFSKNNIV